MKRLENLMDTIARLAGAVSAPLCPIGEGRRLLTAAFALIMTLGALWSGSAQAQSCNLATNGSFESPNIQTEAQRPGENTAFVNGYAVWRTTTYPLDGWQTVSGTVDILRHYSNASHGAQSLDLYGTAAATFRQTFTGLTPGRQYSFSIDYSGHSTAQSTGVIQLGNGNGATPVTLATLRPAIDSVSHGTTGIPTTPAYTVTWRTYQHTFTAAGTAATIQIANTGVYSTTGTGLFIDNFVFAGVGPCETDLSITKSDGEATYTPGLDTTYNIVVTNNGPAPVVGAQVSDTLPAGITTASWTCGNATGGGVCGVASGTGAINTTANLPIGASVTYALTVAIPGSFSGNLSNTATVTVPVGVTDTDTGNNTASDTNTMESPPASTACSPREVAAASSFSLAPLGITGTATRSGAGTWATTNEWTKLGGNYTLTWTFSQPIPVEWLQFMLIDVDPGSPTAELRIELGGGVSINQIVKTDGELLLGAGGIVRRDGAITTDPGQSATFRFTPGGSVTWIRITATNIASNDNIANRLQVRPACVTVQKVSEGGTGSFQINMTNVAATDSTAVPSTTLTTTAADTAVSSPQYFSVPGTAMTLVELVPAGWGITSAVCTDQNAGSTGNPTVVSSFASPTITIAAGNVRPEADIVCRFDNGTLPTINLTKTTALAAGGPFGFTLGNTTVASPAPVSTAASGNTVAVDGDPGAGTAFKVSSLGADVTIEESSLPAGWVVDAASCTDTGGALVGSLAGGRYTIPAASITVGQTFNCSFVNEPTVNLRIDKTANPATLRSGETVTYTMIVNNDGPGAGDGAVVTDPVIPGVDCSAGTLVCGSESGGAVCPASPTVTDLQNIGLTIPALPVGASLQLTLACTVTASGAP
jgi:uncharacterized repeat protein (TIGR01451 family)